MLEIIKGCIVPCSEILCEQYEKNENGFVANINASKIKDVFQQFIKMQSERLFFILELPANGNDEQLMRKDNTKSFHKNIFYIDGLDVNEALSLLNCYDELLINDGISNFGFGVHNNSSEIMKNKYNVVTIWTTTLDKYNYIFEKFDIPCVTKCVNAWETFNFKFPGKSFRIDVDGKTVFDLPNELKEWGIYLGETKDE